jgi:hypothetical protein
MIPDYSSAFALLRSIRERIDEYLYAPKDDGMYQLYLELGEWESKARFNELSYMREDRRDDQPS